MIKICGITRTEDLNAAVTLGATAIGFNRYPPSPRYLSLESCRQLAGLLPSEIAAVIVVVDPTAARLAEDLQARPGLVVQAHLSNHDKLSELPQGPLILAGGVATWEDREALLRRARAVRSHGVDVRAVLADAKVPGLHGGSGQTAAWAHLRDWPGDVPLILAGGLTPANVAAAIATVQPWGVDVASGVESTPGHKDHAKMADFIGEALEAFARIGRKPAAWPAIPNQTRPARAAATISPLGPEPPPT